MAYPNKNMQTNDLFNYYLTMNMNNICRICLEKSNKLTPIFDPIKPPHFSVLITACASVQVEEGDGLPPYICQRCISRLNIAYQFKTQCESSNVKLRQCFENYDLSQEPNYSVYNAKEANVSENDDTPNPVTQESQTQHRQFEIDKVEIVQDETLYCKEASHEQEASAKDEDEETKYNDGKVNVIHVETVSDDHQENRKTVEDACEEEGHGTLHVKFEEQSTVNLTDNESKDSSKKVSKKTPKTHQCTTCGKTFKTKPSLVHHVRIHTGERPYVCHLCHKRFVNGGHLHTHMKTHTGEKNHICSVCNKGFATSQQLTKHTIAIHTSERPYGCIYCPKRFASSSNLNTHIKIHTGEKNYHCEICGKTFSTKGQLQQHMLVHTGEKAFLCEYCNKSFSQKAHLLRHLRTHTRSDLGYAR